MLILKDLGLDLTPRPFFLENIFSQEKDPAKSASASVTDAVVPKETSKRSSN